MLSNLRTLAVAALATFSLSASAQSDDWNVTVLDQILSSTPSGAKVARVGDMEMLVSHLQVWRNQLAGLPGPRSAFSGSAPLWTGGNVYYQFDGSVSAPKQQAFLDAAREWETFANVRFIQRTAQANYILVQEVAGLGGGLATVGMVGGQQTYQIGPTSWDRTTLVHELGHTLGMVHEHQRSDRDSFVTILNSNIISGQEGNFVKLSNSQNLGAYDFLSVMHYSKNAFSVNPGTLNTIEPLPGYSQYLNVLGEGDPVLTPSDRAGMATKYGTGPTISNVVTNTLDGGPGSLRAALYYAFDNAGTTVTFSIPTSDPGYAGGLFTIQPTDSLPGLSRATILDGGSQPGNTNPNGPEILLNGAAAQTSSVYAHGLRLRGTNCTVHSLVINGFEGDGILLDGDSTTGNTVSGCYLGINASGTAAVPNGQRPLNIADGAHGNVIGGTTSGARNVISGSSRQGVTLRDPGTTNNQVLGNYIGLNAAGTSALPNTWAGVDILDGASLNLIGGTTVGAGNVISGNALQGVAVTGTGTDGNVIQSNLIGLNASGTAAVPNQWVGVDVYSGPKSTVIGGATPNAGNVISGNTLQGVLLNGSEVTGSVVQGNLIGLNQAGTAGIANGRSGVQIASGSKSNLIGGTSAGMRNVISGNGQSGIAITEAGSDGNVIAGNFIGLNAAGTAAVPNQWSGVGIQLGASANTVGGTTPGARNFISGNGQQGLLLGGTGTAGNLFQGNTVGLNATHTATIPNNSAYALLYGGATGNQIGGLTPGAANLMSGSPSDSIQIADSGTLNNTVRGNSINGTVGRALGLYDGGNNDASAPTLSSAVMTTNLTVSGSLSNTPNTSFALDFYASPTPTSGQGRTYLGARNVLTSGGGTANFNLALPFVVPAGQILTATATDPNGNTSSMAWGTTVSLTSTVNDGIPNAWRAAQFGGNGTTTNALSCATCDPDQDGADNLEEFRANTNPNLTASVLAVSNPVRSGVDMLVPFASASGVTYRVWAQDNIGSGGWMLLADQIVGTGGVLQLTDPGAAALDTGFYQLQVLP